FKDTAGPALNPLIKVMNLVALLIAPAVVQVSIGAEANHALRLAIATTAMLIAFGAVILSRVRAAAVDREGRLERETHLV
ncbi:MAG TPA: sodium-translocating pyrophosphatase, partial [Actinotalea sp.]|nr:sodium-translocating pyrophosphatase [Actinotalea sp.]